MKKMSCIQLESKLGGGGNFIDGVCAASGTGTAGLTIGAVVKWAGKSVFRSVLGGPVGWTLVAVDTACLVYGIYKDGQ